MSVHWNKPKMRVGQVWAWRPEKGKPIERARLLDVDDNVHVRAELIDRPEPCEVVDRAGTFWCPWDQLGDELEERVAIGVRLEMARAGVLEATRADAVNEGPIAVKVRAPGEASARVAYSLEDAALECGVSPSFLRSFVRRNDLVVHYALSKAIILAEDLRAWVQSLPEER
ncbi:hypothetical protein [Leifsonia sp. AG29]|uniref:hypothetical protein n=1 Tax=Leifsonia sp. AG29 TaxID=2598860 RepID=UPI00131C5A0B|nr:hypothetical protein [Leifsonia sp. AG29]